MENTPDHPRDIRERHGVTQPELASLAGMTTHGVLRYEQGLYAKPSIKYLHALSEISEYSVQELEHSYRWHRNNRIYETTKLFSTILEVPDRREEILQTVLRIAEVNNRLALPDKPSHPFAMFRTRLCAAVGEPLSQIHFCILTCIHPSYLDNFEKGKTARVPRHLSEILVNAGLTKADIDRLNDASKRYQRWVRAND